MKRFVFSFLTVLLASCAAWASSISKSTDEWTTTVTVPRGQEHTFWIKGLTEETAIYGFDVEATYTDADGDESWVSAFESAEVTPYDDPDEWDHYYDPGMYLLLTEEDWEGVTKGSLKFTVTVMGSYDDENKANNSFTFGHIAGRDAFPKEKEVVPEYPTGYDEAHPKKVTTLKTDCKLSQIPSAPTNTNAKAGVTRSQVTTPGNASGNEWYSMENGYIYSLGTLKADQKYMFGLEAPRITWAYTNEVETLITNSAPLRMTLYRSNDPTADLFATADPYTNEWPTCSSAFEVIPTASGTYFINVDTVETFDPSLYIPTNEMARLVEWPSNPSTTFTLVHAGVEARTPENHDWTSAALGASKSFKPGYLKAPDNDFYDGVIDEKLFKFTDFKKGESYIFRTEGAVTNLLMRLYDKNGNILAENRYSQRTTVETNQNVQVGWTATWAGAANNAVYIGVCQDLGKNEEAWPGIPDVTLVIERVTLRDVPSVIAAVPAAATNDPSTAYGVRPSEARQLGTNEWTNTFTLPVRKGCEYQLKILREDPSVISAFSLSAVVSTPSGVWASEGSLDSVDPEECLKFTAEDNTTVSIEISVATDRRRWGNGAGLAYAPYRLCAIMAVNELDVLGFLQFDMKGASQADMGWMLKSWTFEDYRVETNTVNRKQVVTTNYTTTIKLSGEPYYAAGAALALPGGVYEIAAKKLKDFADPGASPYPQVEVRPWYDGEKTGTVNRAIYKYTDTSDPGDDFTQGSYKDASGKSKSYAPVSISPKADFAPISRTLWTNMTYGAEVRNDVDNFKFTADANAFYKFILENDLNKELCPGEAGFTITNAEFHTDIADLTNQTYAAQRRFAKSSKPYILTVAHIPGQEADASYTLTAIAYSPVSITPSTAGASSKNQKFNYGEKYFKAKLTAGNAYHFTVTGSGKTPETITGVRIFEPAGEKPRVVYVTPTDVWVYPNVTGDYFFDVYGGAEGDDKSLKTGTKTFDFTAKVEQQCAMNAHASTQIASFFRDGVADLQRDIGGVTLKPGYVNNPDKKDSKGKPFHDGIVDDALVKLPVPAKKIYLVETEGAATNLVMYVYNSSGTLLQKNYSSDGTDLNTRALLEPGNSSVTYFIGVAQRMVDETKEKPKYLPVRLMVREVVQEDAVKQLKPIPVRGVEDNAPYQDKGCAGVAFASNRWTQTFSFAARKGLSYRFTTETNGAHFASPYRLKASVYTLSGTKKTYLAAPAVQQDLTPGASGLEVYPTANAMHFIEIEVAEGRALDYPAITVHSTVTANETLGVVQVDMKGVEGADAEKMKWKLLTSYVYDTKQKKPVKKSMSGEPWYDNHAWLALPTNTYDFGAQTVANYATPPKNGFTNDVAVAAYADAGATNLLYKYNDKYDPVDDNPDTTKVVPGTKSTKYAPTTLSPSATKPVTVSHSLWTEDTNDWYVITGAADSLYRIELAEQTGNPAVRVFGPDNWTNEVGYVAITNDAPMVHTEAVQFKAEKNKGKYYVKVCHDGDVRKDSTYLLTASMFTPGQIKLSKTEYVVKEDTAYVDVGVSRTGKYGSVRVEYWTEEGSAKPGTEYYPVHGTNVWLSGDQKEQKIRVNLIPDLIPLWANTNKDFRVRFRTFDEKDRIYDDEFIPTFTTTKKTTRVNGQTVTTTITNDTVTIKMTETAKKTPGTIQVADEGQNVKKPVYEVTAGEDITISLERILGTNGIVGVTAQTVKGTANKSGETDFEPKTATFEWPDGPTAEDENVKTFTITTKQTPEDFTTKKTFTVKLTALTSKKGDEKQYDKPTLAASTITVNILNDKYGQSTPDWAKTKTFPAGITGVKEGKSGTWFGTDGSDNNDLYSAIKRTFKGPARVTWGPDWDHQTNLIYVASGKSQTVMMRTEDVYDYDVLTAVEPAAPTVNNAVVTNGPVTLCFNHAENETSRGISNRVYLLSSGDSYIDGRGKKVNYKLGDPATEVLPNAQYAYVTDAEWNTTNKGSYTWRVDSFYVGGTVTNSSKAWTLKVLDERTVKAAPAIEIEGIEEGVSTNLQRGVYASFQVDTTNDATVAFSKVSGSLPDGLKMELTHEECCGKDVSGWFLHGTPTKAGDFEYVFQATYGKTNPKPTTPTYVLKLHVDDLATVTPLAPTVDKAVLTNGWHWLKFEAGDNYRVFFGPDTEKSKFGKDDTYEYEEPYVRVAAGVKYAWQVFTFAEGGTITNKSATFTLTGAATNATGVAYETKIVGQDAYGTNFVEGTAMKLRQRLSAAFRVENYLNDTNVIITGVKAVAGKLPDGLKFEQNKKDAKKNPTGDDQWYVRGTPTKAGTFQAVVQATFAEVSVWNANGTPKTKKDYGAATVVMDFEVEAVETLSDISFSLTGPGRFVYDATDIRYPEGEQEQVVTNWIKAGNQTLKLSDLKHIYEYKYVQLPVVTMLPYLVDKAVVPNNYDVEFKFSEYDHSLTNEGVAFRVFALSEGASWTNVTKDARGNEKKTVVKYKLGDAATEIQPDQNGQYFTNVFYQAKINKGKWTFRVDSYFPGGTVTNAPKSAWSFTVSDKEAAYLPKTWVGGDDVTDVLGYTVNGSARGGQCGQGEYGRIYLRRLVKVDIPVGKEGSTVSKVTGNLPAGVSLKQVEVRKEGKTSIKRWFLTGTPTKAGEYPLVLQEKASNIPGTTTAFTLVVADAGTAEGTFNGLVFTGNSNELVNFGIGTSYTAEDATGIGTTNRLQMIGQVQITAASNGKLSGKLTVAGKSYSFTDTGYTSIRYLGNGAAEDDPTGPFEYTGVMTQIQKMTEKDANNKNVSVPYTNVMSYTFIDLPKTTNLVWQGSNSVGTVEVRMAALPDLKGSGAQKNVGYLGEVGRDNSAIKEWTAEAAKCAGYYTVALAPDNDSVEVDRPHGNGYLTMTVDSKGKAKFAGQLANGTAYSASAVVSTILDMKDGDGTVRFLKLPLYAYKSPTVFGGWLTVAFPTEAAPDKNIAETADDDIPVVVCEKRGLFTDQLALNNDDPLVTCGGTNGYDLVINPVGGWYDTVINLQRYYRSGDYTNYAFSIDTAYEGNPKKDDFIDLRERMKEITDLTGTNYEFVAAASANGMSVDLTGNTLSVAKQSLAKDWSKKYNDWSNSVNAANVSVKFTRATGILTGTCDLWYQGYKRDGKGNLTFEQLKYGGCKHAGVLIMSRGDDPAMPLIDNDVWTAGSVIVPQKVNYWVVTNPKTDAKAKKTRTWNASFRFNILALPVEDPDAFTDYDPNLGE